MDFTVTDLLAKIGALSLEVDVLRAEIAVLEAPPLTPAAAPEPAAPEAPADAPE